MTQESPPSHSYSEDDFGAIAKAVGVHVAIVREHASTFQSAAMFHRFDTERPPKPAPSITARALRGLAKSAAGLLSKLGVESLADAPDGPGNPELLTWLASQRVDEVGRWNEMTWGERVVGDTGRVGRLAEILDGIAAVKSLRERAAMAADDTIRIGKLTTKAGHAGDEALNSWISTMLGLYKKITGSEPRMSVTGSQHENEGEPTGPLIRFLTASGSPIGIKLSPSAWRSRVRNVLKNGAG